MVKRPIEPSRLRGSSPKPPRKPVKAVPVVCQKSEPLLVYYSLWVAGPRPMSGFWFFREVRSHDGEIEIVRVEVTRLEEAREFARQNGYPSLMVKPGGYAGDTVPTATRADVMPSVEMGVQSDRAITGRSARRRGGDRPVDTRGEHERG